MHVVEQIKLDSDWLLSQKTTYYMVLQYEVPRRHKYIETENRLAIAYGWAGSVTKRKTLD